MIQMSKQTAINVYSSLAAIILFFTYMIYTFLKCKSKFSWTSISILLISSILIILYNLIERGVPSPPDPDIPVDTRVPYWIGIISCVLTLLTIIGFGIKNKSILFGCGDVFPWKSFLIPLSSLLIIAVYYLVVLLLNTRKK